MQVLEVCKLESSFSGAMTVSVVFLSVFVALLAFDAFVSFRALHLSVKGK